MNTKTSPILTVQNVCVKYADRLVLDNVSLSVEPAEIRVILGPSGCGKTTLLKTMVGLLTPESGSVSLFGKKLGELDSPQSMDLLKRVGILFQNGALLGSITVGQNVALPLEMHTKLNGTIISEIVELKLSQVGMLHAKDMLPQELSGGMRKRAALARALALDPPLLFCDEPSAGLDPVTAAGLDDLLLTLRKQLAITIVVVTHEIASIKLIADNVVFLYSGSVLYEGRLDGAENAQSGPMNDFFQRIFRASAVSGTSESALFDMEPLQ